MKFLRIKRSCFFMNFALYLLWIGESSKKTIIFRIYSIQKKEQKMGQTNDAVNAAKRFTRIRYIICVWIWHYPVQFIYWLAPIIHFVAMLPYCSSFALLALFGQIILTWTLYSAIHSSVVYLDKYVLPGAIILIYSAMGVIIKLVSNGFISKSRYKVFQAF